jgi:hypothetical protein
VWTKHGGVQICVRDCVLYAILLLGLHVDSDFSWDCVLIVIIIPLRKQPTNCVWNQCMIGGRIPTLKFHLLLLLPNLLLKHNFMAAMVIKTYLQVKSLHNDHDSASNHSL